MLSGNVGKVGKKRKRRKDKLKLKKQQDGSEELIYMEKMQQDDVLSLARELQEKGSLFEREKEEEEEKKRDCYKLMMPSLVSLPSKPVVAAVRRSYLVVMDHMFRLLKLLLGPFVILTAELVEPRLWELLCDTFQTISRDHRTVKEEPDRWLDVRRCWVRCPPLVNELQRAVLAARHKNKNLAPAFRDITVTFWRACSHLVHLCTPSEAVLLSISPTAMRKAAGLAGIEPWAMWQGLFVRIANWAADDCSKIPWSFLIQERVSWQDVDQNSISYIFS